MRELALAVLLAASALAPVSASAQMNPSATVGNTDEAAVRSSVRAWISDHVPEARKMLSEAIAAVSPGEDPMDGQLGNRTGETTVTAFIDRTGENDKLVYVIAVALEQLDRNVKIEIKELPWASRGSVDAAVAAVASRKQGTDLSLKFEGQVVKHGGASDLASIRNEATLAGLDMAKFEADAADPSVKAYLRRTRTEADRLGVVGTPTWFVGSTKLDGVQGLRELKAAIAAERAR